MLKKETETAALLQECDAGIKMGIASIAEVLDQVKSQELYRFLADCKREHEYLGRELEELLSSFGEEERQPSAAAKGIAWFKTNVKMAASPGDATIADLMTDGCNTGIKALRRALNRAPDALPLARNVAQRLILTEETLARRIAPFL